MSSFSFSQPTAKNLQAKLAQYCQTLPAEFDKISDERKILLEEISEYIYKKQAAHQAIQFTVICTHNSRRSHMGQLWLEAAAAWYGIDQVGSYSGGTEATAFNPRAVAAMKRAGFEITKSSQSENPRYTANYLKDKASSPDKLIFSKKYDDAVNPSANFAAIMVCNSADQSCPIVSGAEARFSLPFDDPKNFDGTPTESAAYDHTCRLIAREIFYVMQQAKKRSDTDLEKR